MGAVVERFGGLVAAQASAHPGRARWLLSSAYRLVGAQMRYIPPKGMSPARSYMQSVTSPMMGKALSRPGTCACVNVFLPCELLHAMDITPMIPEGLSCYLVSTAAERPFLQAAEEHGVPESYCSYHKLLLGLAESGVLPAPLCVLNTSLACDANQLTFRRLAERYGVPRFTVDVPMGTSSADLDYVADQLRAMGAFLEKCSGRRLDPERLRLAMERSRRTVEDYRRYLDGRASCSRTEELSAEMFAVMALHPLLGTEESARFAALLARETVARPGPSAGKRILWMHTVPHWQASLMEVLSKSGRCEIVACDMNYEGLAEIDPDRPYESMARRRLESGYNGGAERRVRRSLDMARRLNADGVVYFCHWGCKQTSGAAQYAKRTLEDAGFPTLVLDGDGCDSGNVNDGQMLTRLQAFLEQLEG